MKNKRFFTGDNTGYWFTLPVAAQVKSVKHFQCSPENLTSYNEGGNSGKSFQKRFKFKEKIFTNFLKYFFKNFI